MYDGGVPRMKVQDVVAQSTAEKLFVPRDPKRQLFIETAMTTCLELSEASEALRQWVESVATRLLASLEVFPTDPGLESARFATP